MSDLTDAQKTLLIDNVHKAVDLWNSVYMHDGTGYPVSLIEVVPDSFFISGTHTCPIIYNPSLSGLSGHFNPIPFHYKIEIKRYNAFDTILHELGHLLGLQDLDMNHSEYVHNALMGYGSGRNGLSYHDIQGVSVESGKHTNHEFSRYAFDDGVYKHVCFYCDVMDTESSPLAGSVEFEESSNCVHEYLQIVSAGNRHWLKCKKCYKVVEADWQNSSTPNDGTISYKYDSQTGGYMVDGLSTHETDVVIPPTFDGKQVKTIAASAFANMTYLTNVTISEL